MRSTFMKPGREELGSDLNQLLELADRGLEPPAEANVRVSQRLALGLLALGSLEDVRGDAATSTPSDEAASFPPSNGISSLPPGDGAVSSMAQGWPAKRFAWVFFAGA